MIKRRIGNDFIINVQPFINGEPVNVSLINDMEVEVEYDGARKHVFLPEYKTRNNELEIEITKEDACCLGSYSVIVKGRLENSNYSDGYKDIHFDKEAFKIVPRTSHEAGEGLLSVFINSECRGKDGVDGNVSFDLLTENQKAQLKGKSAYHSYLETTNDNPPMSEGDWSNPQNQRLKTIQLSRRNSPYVSDNIKLPIAVDGVRINIHSLMVRNGFGDHYVAGHIVYNTNEDGTTDYYLNCPELSLAENWEIFILRYTTEQNDLGTYLPDIRGKIGRNFIQEENANQKFHAAKNTACFEHIYGKGNRNVLRSDLFYGGAIPAELTDEISVKYKANIYARPYSNANVSEHISGSPEILKIIPHSTNTFHRVDITTGPDDFIDTLIAVSSGRKIYDVSDWGTSYGFGVEFCETWDKDEVDARYSKKFYENYRDFGAGIIDSVSHVNSFEVEDNTSSFLTKDYDFMADLSAGDSVIVQYYMDGRTVEQTSDLVFVGQAQDRPGWVGKWRKFTINNVFPPIGSDRAYSVFFPITIGRAFNYNPQQSPVCSIVAAKFALIQDATDAPWQICRTAARMTASNSTYNEQTKTYTPHWDMYRGFGIIDVEKAIAYIKNNFTDNEEYKKNAVLKLSKVNPFLSIDDLDDNNPISKKMLMKIISELNAKIDAIK